MKTTLNNLAGAGLPALGVKPLVGCGDELTYRYRGSCRRLRH